MPSGYRERRERRLDEVDRLLLALLPLREWDLLLLARLNNELPWSESGMSVGLGRWCFLDCRYCLVPTRPEIVEDWCVFKKRCMCKAEKTGLADRGAVR